MNGEEEISRRLGNLGFSDEPPMTSMAADDLRRGRRHLRRRRLATWTTGVAGVTVLATGVAVALPGDGSGPAREQEVAAGAPTSTGTPTDGGAPTSGGTPSSTGTPTTGGTPSSTGTPTEPTGPDGLQQRIGYQRTRQLLLDTAVEHFDPEREHLPDESSNGQSGGVDDEVRVGTKLGWTVPGQSGLGLVQVAVTVPGYAGGEHALQSFAMNIGCEVGSGACTKQPIPGTEQTALVADADPEMDRQFAVVHERADGSLVGVAVYDLFGNNSTEPVSSVDVELEDAFAYVTDADLRVDPADVSQARENDSMYDRHPGSEVSEQPLDFSSDETAAAPPASDMSADEMSQVVQQCVDGAPGWEGFEPTFGVRADVTADEGTNTSWVLAHDGGKRLVCGADSDGRLTGGARFGDAAAKSNPYLIEPVVPKDGGFGMYTADVARVTVQASGGPEQDAIMRDGYWFVPMAGDDLSAFAYRGYDADGELVYDSTTVDTVETCYTDPDGTEIIRKGAQQDPALEDCEPAHEWNH